MNNGIKQQTLWQFAGIVIAIISLVVTLGVWFLGTKFESQDRYLESRFDRVDEKFDSVNARIDELKPNTPETQASVAYSPAGSTP